MFCAGVLLTGNVNMFKICSSTSQYILLLLVTNTISVWVNSSNCCSQYAAENVLSEQNAKFFYVKP